MIQMVRLGDFGASKQWEAELPGARTAVQRRRGTIQGLIYDT